jgi:HK97 family phage prohead protease
MGADWITRRDDLYSKRHTASSCFVARPDGKPVPTFPGRATSERKFVDLVVEELEGDGCFSGYASLFGRVDLGRDVVESGAFAKSLRTRGPGGIRMLFQHDPREPIGIWTELKEDARGLYVRGRLTEGVSRSQEVLRLMRGGALDGLSIGFRAVRAKNDSASGVRRILEADLWEISIVTFPMLPDARIERVKGLGRKRPLPTTRQFERWLTQQAGLTRDDARAVIAKGFATLIRERDATRSSPDGILKLIREATEMINGKDLS